MWKVFGSMGVTFLFIIAQMPLVKRHKLPEPSSPNGG
jgi:intracellular septation protein A